MQLTNPGKSPHHSFCAFQPNALLDPFDTFPKSCFWNPFTFFFGLAGFLPGRVTSLLSFTLALKIEFSSSSSPLLRQRCCVIPASSDQCLYKKHCQPPSPSSIPVPPLRLFFFFFIMGFSLFYSFLFSSILFAWKWSVQSISFRSHPWTHSDAQNALGSVLYTIKRKKQDGWITEKDSVCGFTNVCQGVVCMEHSFRNLRMQRTRQTRRLTL